MLFLDKDIMRESLELQEKEAQKLKHTGNSLRKNLHLKGGC